MTAGWWGGTLPSGPEARVRGRFYGDGARRPAAPLPGPPATGARTGWQGPVHVADTSIPTSEPASPNPGRNPATPSGWPAGTHHDRSASR